MFKLGSVYLTVHIYWLSTQMYTMYTDVLVSSLNKAAITNYHKLSGLEEHIFTFIQLWRSGVHHQLHWAKVKLLAGLVLETRKGESVSLPFSASSGCPYSLVYGPVLQLQSNLCFYHHITFLSSWLLLCPCDYTEPTRIIQNNLFTLRSFTWSYLQTPHL